jgi:hypothetical protein
VLESKRSLKEPVRINRPPKFHRQGTARELATVEQLYLKELFVAPASAGLIMTLIPAAPEAGFEKANLS